MTPPDPLTEQRIAIAGKLVADFARLSDETDRETNLADLITDLGHWAHANGIDYAAVLQRAFANWHSEHHHPDGDGPPVTVTITITPPHTGEVHDPL